MLQMRPDFTISEETARFWEQLIDGSPLEFHGTAGYVPDEIFQGRTMIFTALIRPQIPG